MQAGQLTDPLACAPRGSPLQGDFACCMKLLQRYPPVDVHVILARAEALKRTRTVIALPD